jgi:short-subunit dehydrogenase
MANGKFAIVTGASTGIGFHLAECCAQDGYDLLIAADEPEIQTAAETLRRSGASVEAIQTDLSTTEGVDKLLAAARGRKVDALLANAGRGLGRAFLDQDFQAVRKVIETNITGTLYLIHNVGKRMQTADDGKILITGSIAGFMPGTFQAVYNGTKAFIDSFSQALRNEMKESKVTVTCLMPGATETEFFQRADLMDTRVGAQEKDDPAEVAKTGYKAMLAGDDQVIYGFKNKLQAAAAHVLPAGVTAEMHRTMAEPGTARKAG